MRICSLLPSATEIVGELGLVESLVAISEECDWPPEVRGLPVVTASRVDAARMSSLEIDKAVREAVGDGRPLYAIDRDLLETLEPDLILNQNLGEVCAVSADKVNELCATDAEVVALDARTLAEIEACVLSPAHLLVSSAAWWPGEWGPNGEWEARTLDTGLPMIVCNRTGCDHTSQLFDSESVVVDRGEKLLALRAPESTVFIVDCQLRNGHIAKCELIESTVLSQGDSRLRW